MLFAFGFGIVAATAILAYAPPFILIGCAVVPWPAKKSEADGLEFLATLARLAWWVRATLRVTALTGGVAYAWYATPVLHAVLREWHGY